MVPIVYCEQRIASHRCFRIRRRDGSQQRSMYRVGRLRRMTDIRGDAAMRIAQDPSANQRQAHGRYNQRQGRDGDSRLKRNAASSQNRYPFFLRSAVRTIIWPFSSRLGSATGTQEA